MTFATDKATAQAQAAKLVADLVTASADAKTLSTEIAALAQDAPVVTPAPPVVVPPPVVTPPAPTLFTEDFSRNCALGQFDSIYTDFGSYHENYNTTDGNGVYSTKNLSVSNGVLDVWLRARGASGRPEGAALIPFLRASTGNFENDSAFTYGQVNVYVKAMTGDFSKWHMAWLLWAQTEQWSDGVFDLFEGGNQAFLHGLGSADSTNIAWGQSTKNAYDGGPHVISGIWGPGGCQSLIDGVVDLSYAKPWSSLGHRFTLQCETGGVPTTDAHVLIDKIEIVKLG